eukprot:8153951-Pyramimonas_sp.AAC.1
MQLDDNPDVFHVGVADASPTTPMHRRYIGDAVQSSDPIREASSEWGCIDPTLTSDPACFG